MVAGCICYDTNVACMEIDFDKTDFISNMANKGGAMYIIRSRNNSDSKRFQTEAGSGNVSININDAQINYNSANYTGGAIHFRDDESCKFVSSNIATISSSFIEHNQVQMNGGGIYAQCVEMNIEHTSISNNTITFFGDYENQVTCADPDCIRTYAESVIDDYGGAGAGIYSSSSSMTVRNNTLNGNRILMGNGAAFASMINEENKYLKSQDLKLIFEDNTVENNEASVNQSDEIKNELDCGKWDGLMDFGGMDTRWTI